MLTPRGIRARGFALYSKPLDRRRENVSDAPLGLDHLGSAWVLFQLAAKTQNLHVDAAIEDVLVDPRRLQEMLPAERALGSVEEGDKQRIFAFGQSDLGSVRGGEAARAQAQPPPAKLVAAALVIAWRSRAGPV